MPDPSSVDSLLHLTRRLARALRSCHDPEARDLDAAVFRLDRCLIDIRNNYPPAPPLLWIDDVAAALHAALRHLPPSHRTSQSPPYSTTITSTTSTSPTSLLSLLSPHRLSTSLSRSLPRSLPRSIHSTPTASLSEKFRSSVSHLLLGAPVPPASPSVSPLHHISTATRTVNEWLAAVGAATSQNTVEDAESCISLSDALPPLPHQYAACRDHFYQCARDALLTAAAAPHLSTSTSNNNNNTNNDNDNNNSPISASARHLGHSRKTPAVALVGPHGVGKTMLAMELVQDLDLCHCFADGVAWIQLGPDITHEELADQIIRCVETIIAGDFRSTVRYSSDLMYVVERASRILKHVACLVVVDDVAGPNAQWAFDTVVRALGPSCVALFTVPTEPRGERPVRGGEPGGSDPLSMANVMCVAKLFVKPLEPASHEAGIIFRSWLTKSQSDQSRDGSLRHAKEQVTIVDACFGLPLPLAMTAGFLSRFHNSWSFLATQLASSKSPQDTIFRILHILLQRGGAKFRAQLKDIACLPCGVWVSLSTLADVWGMDYRTVKMSARRLGRMAFAEYRLGDSSDDSRVRFHWHLLQFSNTLASEQDVKLAHRKLIANISRRRSASQHLKQRFKTDYLPWWSGCVSDKYICRRLHWHISGAEALATLKDLICDYQWVCQRLERDGLLGIISEFLVALSAEEKDGCDVEVVGLKHVLSAIQQAASLRKSEGLEINALPTFLFSRLAQHERHSRCCRDFLNSIYEKARRPWLKPIPASEPPVLDLSALESVCSSDSMESESMPYLVNCLTSSVSGKVVYGDRLGNIQVYDPASGKNIVSWGSSPVGGGAHPLSRGVGALATVQDYVISGHLNGRMFLRSIRSGRTETIQNTGEGGGSGGSGGSGGNDKITCIATTEGGIVAVGTQTGRLFVLRTVQDFESVPQRIDLQGHCDVVTSLHIFPGGRRVASSSYDGFAAIWKIDDDDDDDGLQRISLNGHKPDIGHKENYITTFATICGGKRLLSSCRGGVVSAWNTDNGACIWTLRYGYEFSRTLSLYAFGVRYFTQAMTDGGEGAVERGKGGGVNLLNIGYPYVITRGEGPRDLLILAAGNGREVLATVTTDQVISTWMEVWHPSTQRIYIAVSHADGRLSSFELVTSLK